MEKLKRFNKAFQGGAGGAAGVVVVFLLKELGVVMTPDVEGAVTLLVVAGLGALFPAIGAANKE